MDTFDSFDAHESGFCQSLPNALGGSDIYHDGELVNSTIPNIFDGVDVYDGEHHLIGHTMPNLFGGEDVYDGDWQLEGQTMSSVFDGEDCFDFGGNVEDILSYEDPLQHADECQFPQLALS